MSQNKKEYRPELLLEEIDFKKQINITPETEVIKKYNFLKDLKKDISFISIVSISLFAILGNISIYMFHKNPPSVTYIPKQINLSETDLIKNTANVAAKNLLNFNSLNVFDSKLKDYFYKDNFEQWKSKLKQVGIYDKIINNKGEVLTDINDVNIISKVIVHGMVRTIVSIPFTQRYIDKNENTFYQGNLTLTIIENPEKENQFLIYNTNISMEEKN